MFKVYRKWTRFSKISDLPAIGDYGSSPPAHATHHTYTLQINFVERTPSGVAMADYPETLLRDRDHDDEPPFTDARKRAPVVGDSNLMIDERGTIKIIDFGSAILRAYGHSFKSLPKEECFIRRSGVENRSQMMRVCPMNCTAALQGEVFGEGFVWDTSNGTRHPSCVWDGAKTATFLSQVERFGACHANTRRAGRPSSLVDPRWRASLSSEVPPCVDDPRPPEPGASGSVLGRL